MSMHSGGNQFKSTNDRQTYISRPISFVLFLALIITRLSWNKMIRRTIIHVNTVVTHIRCDPFLIDTEALRLEPIFNNLSLIQSWYLYSLVKGWEFNRPNTSTGSKKVIGRVSLFRLVRRNKRKANVVLIKEVCIHVWGYFFLLSWIVFSVFVWISFFVTCPTYRRTVMQNFSKCIKTILEGPC